jgi:hypothetical protein
MEWTGAPRKRAIEERGGNRDALVEGNIVADERQLDPESGVRADATGSDREMSAGENEESARRSDEIRDPSGGGGGDREEGADDLLKDGSIPADADLDMPSDAMNDPEQLEDDSRG